MSGNGCGVSRKLENAEVQSTEKKRRKEDRSAKRSRFDGDDHADPKRTRGDAVQNNGSSSSSSGVDTAMQPLGFTRSNALV